MFFIIVSFLMILSRYSKKWFKVYPRVYLSTLDQDQQLKALLFNLVNLLKIRNTKVFKFVTFNSNGMKLLVLNLR